MTKAFITGSHAYGTPHAKSDLDIVMLVDDDAGDALVKICDDVEMETYDEIEDACLRFGKLNLIMVTSQAIYDAWKTGTEQLITRKPVTRDEAVKVFTALRAAARETEFHATVDELTADARGASR